MKQDKVSRAILAAIEDSTDSLVGLLDAAGRVVYANPAGLRFLGIADGDEPRSVNWATLIAPAQHGVVSEAISRIVAGEKRLDLDLYLRPAHEAETRRMRLRISRAQLAADDEALWMIWANENVLRAHLEERLRLTSERLEKTLDGGSILAFGHDLDLRIKWVRNPASGRAPESLIGLTDFDVLEKVEEAEQITTHKRQVLERGEPLRFEQSLTFGNALRYYDYLLTPERDAEGRVIGLLGIAFDITERRLAEAALREEQRRKDEFIALLGHELRWPLSPIRNVLALMREDPANAPHRLHLGVINRQMGYMVRLIDDLLDLSRMSRDLIRLKVQPFDLMQLVRAAANPERYFAVSRPTAPLRLDASDAALMFDGDRDRIGQILGNLLNNARKFTPAHGEISMGVKVEPHQVQITVSDTGVGIDPKDAARIFERFEQIPRPDGGHSGGLGLGLYLSRRLAELHGGRLELESAGLGLGSSFHLTLPRRPVVQAVVPAERVMPAPAAPLSVLLVDDHRDTVDTMSALLLAWGHSVQCAGDGLQGLSAAQSMRPDVVILDVDMPGIDGFEMARRIRAESWGRSMRLLALTGFSQPQHLATGRAVGLDAHFTKPADLSRLRRLLREWSPPV